MQKLSRTQFARRIDRKYEKAIFYKLKLNCKQKALPAVWSSYSNWAPFRKLAAVSLFKYTRQTEMGQHSIPDKTCKLQPLIKAPLTGQIVLKSLFYDLEICHEMRKVQFTVTEKIILK